MVVARCMGTKTWPGCTVGVTNTRAGILPRRDSTTTQSSGSRPSAAASSGDTSTWGWAGARARRVADLSVRVPVCHWAVVPAR